MTLRQAFLLSLTAHIAAILAAEWPTAVLKKPQPSIEVRLMTPVEASGPTESVSSEASAEPKISEVPEKPKRLEGASLRNAHAALSRHLYYPPAAVAQGLEGEVILLLTLTSAGHLANVEIARSSGHGLLDDAAVDAARRIGQLQGTGRQMLFPVSFRLN